MGPGVAAVKDEAALPNSNSRNDEGARRFYFVDVYFIIKRIGTNEMVIRLDHILRAFKQDISFIRVFRK